MEDLPRLRSLSDPDQNLYHQLSPSTALMFKYMSLAPPFGGDDVMTDVIKRQRSKDDSEIEYGKTARTGSASNRADIDFSTYLAQLKPNAAGTHGVQLPPIPSSNFSAANSKLTSNDQFSQLAQMNKIPASMALQPTNLMMSERRRQRSRKAKMGGLEEGGAILAAKLDSSGSEEDQSVARRTRPSDALRPPPAPPGPAPQTQLPVSNKIRDRERRENINKKLQELQDSIKEQPNGWLLKKPTQLQILQTGIDYVKKLHAQNDLLVSCITTMIERNNSLIRECRDKRIEDILLSQNMQMKTILENAKMIGLRGERKPVVNESKTDIKSSIHNLSNRQDFQSFDLSMLDNYGFSLDRLDINEE